MPIGERFQLAGSALHLVLGSTSLFGLQLLRPFSDAPSRLCDGAPLCPCSANLTCVLSVASSAHPRSRPDGLRASHTARKPRATVAELCDSWATSLGVIVVREQRLDGLAPATEPRGTYRSAAASSTRWPAIISASEDRKSLIPVPEPTAWATASCTSWGSPPAFCVALDRLHHRLASRSRGGSLPDGDGLETLEPRRRSSGRRWPRLDTKAA